MNFIAVDDEPLVLNVIIKAIQDAATGCTVQGFTNSAEALDAVKSGLRLMQRFSILKCSV